MTRNTISRFIIVPGCGEWFYHKMLLLLFIYLFATILFKIVVWLSCLSFSRCRGQTTGHNFKLFQQFSKFKFSLLYLNSACKVQIIEYKKPGIGLEVLELAPWISRKYIKFQVWTLKLKPAWKTDLPSIMPLFYRCLVCVYFISACCTPLNNISNVQCG